MAIKGVFWLVGLFAAAVALALLMGQNGATITLFWAPYRVDMSFNLVLGGALLLFLLLYVTLRSLATLRALPRQALRWRLQQRERVVHAAVLDALSHQLAGRYVRARSAARQVIEQLDHAASQGTEPLARQSQVLAMAHLLAAEATHALQDRDKRDRHLAQALGPTATGAAEQGVVREGAMLAAIRWALEDRDLDSASHWLSQLPQGASRRTLALRLKLRVARLAQDHTMALETARLLAKHKAFSDTAARSILRRLLMAALQASHDPDQVLATWQTLDAADRQDPELVLAAIARLQAVSAGESDPARVQARCLEWTLPLWEQYASLTEPVRQRLATLLPRLLPDSDASWLGRIENLQRQRPADPLLQYLAADVFYRQQLWGKAEAMFRQAARSLGDEAMRVHTWVRLAQLAEARSDEPAALQAWRTAALHAQVNVNTGVSP